MRKGTDVCEIRAEQSRAEQSRADQSRAEQIRADQSRSEQSRADQSREEQRRAETKLCPTACCMLLGLRGIRLDLKSQPSNEEEICRAAQTPGETTRTQQAAEGLTMVVSLWRLLGELLGGRIRNVRGQLQNVRRWEPLTVS
eukprot:511937-Hanusia_phi.AAC.1